MFSLKKRITNTGNYHSVDYSRNLKTIMDRSKKENPRENYFLSLKECVNPKHFKRVALLEKKLLYFRYRMVTITVQREKKYRKEALRQLDNQ